LVSVGAKLKKEMEGGERVNDSAALLVRLVQGSLLAGHGVQKLFGHFEGPGLEGTTGFMEMLGLRPGRPWAVLAGLSEFGGGVLTVLGLLNPLGPIGVIASMSMATATAHRGKPIWVTEGGAELPVTNTAVSTALILNGPGKYSLDRALGIRLPAWLAPLGLAVTILTVLYAGVGGEEPPDQDEAREELAGEES
jgi:putative oxidoreductase